ncbi:hypothetical protein [Agrobacterium arsenijevicii]|uniref:hypothetical protein n=1 Tax=Agrobacterium arsenijevicii TaxID=1585697 RepID=UPI001111A1AB
MSDGPKWQRLLPGQFHKQTPDSAKTNHSATLFRVRQEGKHTRLDPERGQTRFSCVRLGTIEMCQFEMQMLRGYEAPDVAAQRKTETLQLDQNEGAPIKGGRSKITFERWVRVAQPLRKQFLLCGKGRDRLFAQSGQPIVEPSQVL